MWRVGHLGSAHERFQLMAEEKNQPGSEQFLAYSAAHM
jgi:hypothetical protein